jgi:hypothetical protein
MNDNSNLKDIFTQLSEPFHPDDIEWRAGATNNDKTKALALAYITSRAVMDRLDEVVGPENWRDEYASGPDGGVICGLTLRINGEWITKWDGAENTEFEAIKGGLSDAFKRAGYKWGIGRYLYKLDKQWVFCDVHGKTLVLRSTPPLPSWALPKELRAPSASSQSSADREAQILKELGFEPVLQKAPESSPALVSPGPGSNGQDQKTQANPTNGKRPSSWSAVLVRAVLDAGLAASPIEAVRLLNDSGLPSNATPEQVVARIQEMLNS